MPQRFREIKLSRMKSNEAELSRTNNECEKQTNDVGETLKLPNLNMPFISVAVEETATVVLGMT